MSDFPRSILLTGGQGMLARALRTTFERPGTTLHVTDRHTLDVTDAQAISRFVEEREIELILNAAAFTDVDGAETQEDRATAINGHAVGHLARAAAAVGARLVNYSTDYVFNGRAESPYPRDHGRAPLGAYGRSKAVGEEALETSDARWLNLRTSWLYAPWGKNFVLTMQRLTGEKDQLKVVHDQRGRPTSSQHLASVTLGLLQQGATGHHHGCDGGQCSWYEFTVEIARQLNHTCQIQPCTTQDFPRPAPRPAYSVMDLSATEALLGPMPAWQANVQAVLHQTGNPA